MDELTTLSGKKFRYKGEISEELIVYPSDKGNKHQDKFALVITPYTTNIVMSAIRREREILMGASRDNPPPKSLGALLKKERQTPQQLSYLVPILIQRRLCDSTKEGNSFVVRYKGR